MSVLATAPVLRFSSWTTPSTGKYARSRAGVLGPGGRVGELQQRRPLEPLRPVDELAEHAQADVGGPVLEGVGQRQGGGQVPALVSQVDGQVAVGLAALLEAIAVVLEDG